MNAERVRYMEYVKHSLFTVACQKKLKLPVVCLLIFGLIHGTTFTAHASWEDRLRSIRNFFTITRDLGGGVIDYAANPGADDLDKAEDELLR